MKRHVSGRSRSLIGGVQHLWHRQQNVERQTGQKQCHEMRQGCPCPKHGSAAAAPARLPCAKGSVHLAAHLAELPNGVSLAGCRCAPTAAK